jgi:predicted O-linked N-acetylglucosamine transferase (SPINDLY family)
MTQPSLNEYATLAGQGLLRLDQLFQKSEELQNIGLVKEALALYRLWLDNTQDTNRYIALFNYGSLLQSDGNLTEAQAIYRQCIENHPQLAQATINLGLILEKTGQQDEAIAQWLKLVEPKNAQTTQDPAMRVMALNHIGRVYENKRDYELAEQQLEKSLAIDPKQAGVLQHWIHIRQKACQWPVYKHLPHISKNQMLMCTSPLAMLALHDDAGLQLLAAKNFVHRTYDFEEKFLSKGVKYEHEKTRIGYVSGDLCVHAVGLLLASVFESHDKEKFDLYAYDFSPEDGSAQRQRLKSSFVKCHDIRHMKDREVAELILSDEIDILIDLHGLSSGARPEIFAMHPAPTQGTYLGFIGTTGMTWFDFVLTDKYAMPDELAPYFTEQPVFLDQSFIPLVNNESDIRHATRSEFALPEDAFVMAAFGNVYKITPDMFCSWANILKRLPEAILWLIDDNATTTRNLQAHAVSHGLDLARLKFTPRAAHAEFLAKIKLADVFLDTYPYNCGSTTNDVIQAGTPIVTLSGKTMVSRMGGSILTHLGMTSNIAHNYNEYENKVVEIAAHRLSR